MPAIRTRALGPGEKIRVLVVDDSVVIRRLVSHALEHDPLMDVVGVAGNGSIGLTRIPQVNPHVVTLDIEMPEMNGLEMLQRVKRDHPEIRVVMFSTLTERGATATIEALALGADDYVTKASNAGSLDVSLQNLQVQLIPKIKQFFSIPGSASAPRVAPPPASSSRPLGPRPEVVAIGVSTGGPTALGQIIPQIPENFPLPILIVQHMPPLFTRFLAERLATATRLRVSEGASGDLVEPGHIYIAPGDYHMRVVRSGRDIRIALSQDAPLNSCRPAVDALFSSVAEVYGNASVAAVLTGMGCDGLVGARCLKARGAPVLAQDEASSVVWGMPGAVATAGLADEVVPLERIVPAILRRVAA